MFICSLPLNASDADSVLNNSFGQTLDSKQLFCGAENNTSAYQYSCIPTSSIQLAPASSLFCPHRRMHGTADEAEQVSLAVLSSLVASYLQPLLLL